MSNVIRLPTLCRERHLEVQAWAMDCGLVRPLARLDRLWSEHTPCPWQSLIEDSQLLVRGACGMALTSLERRRWQQLGMDDLSDVEVLTVVLDNLYRMTHDLQGNTTLANRLRGLLECLSSRLERLLQGNHAIDAMVGLDSTEASQ